MKESTHQWHPTSSQHVSPRRASTPSLTMIGTITRAATGSANHQLSEDSLEAERVTLGRNKPSEVCDHNPPRACPAFGRRRFLRHCGAGSGPVEPHWPAPVPCGRASGPD